MDAAVQLTGIRKSFSGVPVLKGVDFSLTRGEVHALMGENGAGKTTLMNLLGGVIQPDEGKIIVGGRSVSIANPRASQALGISFIHQELNLVGDLRIYENMFLGAELTDRFGMLNDRAMCERAAATLARLGVSLDPRTYVSDLDAAMKQLVEIAKALLQDATVLIMDEPTASLTEREIAQLYTLIATLKASGVSIVFISHKLKEVFRICDRYTVLRDGEVAASGLIETINEETLAQLMVSREVSNTGFYRPRAVGPVVLHVRNLSCGRLVHDVNFQVRRGEVVGFTGLTGDGRTELFECIFGYRHGYTGDIYIDGHKRHPRHPSDALAFGLGYVPKDRKENAIIKDMSVLHNMTLASLRKFARFAMLDGRQERAQYEAYRRQLNLKASHPNLPMTSLSGGNQQKAVLAKWLLTDSNVLILDNPTQGVDIGAKAEIYQLIGDLAEQGKAIVALSTEVPEILKICDRVYVMHRGAIVAELTRDEASEDKILMLASGLAGGKAAGGPNANESVKPATNP
jgi:ribose transport system ATP-binding protein